jgi:hypothetical protein
VIVVVVADHNLLNQPILAELAPDVLVERVEVVLELRRVHLVVWEKGWVQVKVREEYRLGVGRFDMLAGASITVSTSANLVVEAAVDLVLLRSENRG